MSRAIENYICANEDRSHYNCDRYESYPVYRFKFRRLPIPPVPPPTPHPHDEMRQQLKKQVYAMIQNYIKNLDIQFDGNYEHLSNIPTVNGEPLIGDLSRYLDNLSIEQLQAILQEEGTNG